jgi:hypothetical protein
MSDEQSQELIRLLQRTNELLTSLALHALGPALDEELGKPKLEQLYRLTGGELPVKAISKRIGIAAGVISETWQRWERRGLLVKDGHRYRKVLR